MIHFIYNPNAGIQNEAQKKQYLDSLHAIPNAVIWETTKPLEAKEFAKKAIEQKASRIIAIGGDGTVNEIGSVLTATNTPLGIIPIGSGNGLARHLQLPLQFDKALARALSGKELAIDVGIINDRKFFCTTGIGFDAAVASRFAKGSDRGFMNYVKSTFYTLFNYKPIEISINGGPLEKVFSITIANANQFGSNAYISPYSDLQDAQLEMVAIQPHSILKAATLTIRLFNKTIHASNKVSIRSIQHITIQYKKGMPIHVDGESLETDMDDLAISVEPLALLVIV
ncbi:MAG: diacylglycerol kinase family protein [Chitinophagia bacterium]